jgi:hypothetical protein
MIFSDAGTVTIVIGAMIDGKYQLEGNQLKVDAPASGLPPFQTVRFVADTAKIAASKFTRTLIPMTAPAEPNSLVGQWRSTDAAGVTTYEEYSAGGSMRLRVPIEVWKGFYSVKGNLMTMRLLYPRMDERTASLTLTPRTLALRGRDGRTDLFVRAEPLVPTDVEQPAQPR